MLRMIRFIFFLLFLCMTVGVKADDLSVIKKKYIESTKRKDWKSSLYPLILLLAHGKKLLRNWMFLGYMLS